MCLDDFVLKMKQGESVEFRLNNSSKIALACPMKVDKDIMLVNFLDKRSLKPVWNKENGATLMGDLLISSNQNKVLYLNNGVEIRGLVYRLCADSESNYAVENIWDVNEKIKDIICSYQGDNAVLKENEKYLKFKDVHNIKYFDETGWLLGETEFLKISPVVMIGLGINNFAYAQGKFLMRNDLKIENILGYMKFGLEYLRYTPEVRDYDVELYKSLFERYMNVKAHVSEFLEDEIIARLSESGKQSVYVNGKNIKEFEIQRMEHKIYDYKNKRDINFEDINTLQYKGKEIFNREKELKRLESDVFQAGIKGMIQWIRQKDNYNKFMLDLDYESVGDLVYTKQGHFGVVIEENTVCLDNGKKIQIEDECDEDKNMGLYKIVWRKELNKWKDYVDVVIKECELNRGLKAVKEFITDNYCNEQFKVRIIEDKLKRG